MYIIVDIYEDTEVIGITRTKSRANEIICCRHQDTDGECDCIILEYYGEIED